jgi:tetratricopeptide (TPR) repeat protein
MEVPMKFASRVLPPALLVLAFALPSQAQTGTILGEVINYDGSPMEGAVLVVERTDISQTFEAETGPDGRYRLVVPRGDYRVTLQVDGSNLTFVGGLVVDSNEQEITDFNLQELADTPEARAAMEVRARAEATSTAFDVGLAALDAGEFEEAINQFTIAAESDDTQHIIFANLGSALSGAEQYADAADAYQKAILLAPAEAGYYNNLGVAYGRTGQIDQAIEALDQAAQLRPEIGGDAYYNLGVLLTNTGQMADAAAAYQRAVTLDPTHAEAYYQLGIAYFGSATTIPDAIPAFEKYLELTPDGPNAEAASGLLAAAQASAGQ